jgi:NTE family protein
MTESDSAGSGGSGLVLGGGGITGIAWEIGLLAGLAAAGVNLLDADTIIGTSAGSIVGAQITSGTPIEELYEGQLAPPDTERLAKIGLRVKLGFAVALVRSRGNLTAFGRNLGRLSVKADAAGRLPSLESRYEAITARLPSLEWPDRELWITVVDAATGEFRILRKEDGVALRDAVAASCAVPAVYPPVPIDGRLYVDGGARTGANADLAVDCDRVIALTPMTQSVRLIPSAAQQVHALGVPSLVLGPDMQSLAAIGSNVLDPAARAATAQAGRAQAARVADQIEKIWTA